MRKVQRVLAVAMIGAALASPAFGQPGSTSVRSTAGEITELRVAVTVIPPFIMDQDGSLTGFSIDLWNAIAVRLKLKTSYVMEPDVSALEQAMRSKTADLTVAPVFITSARDEVFDFSYPMLETGLQIMVRGVDQNAQFDNPLSEMLRLMLSRATVVWLSVALLLVLIPAHAVWLLERRHENGMLSSRNYFPGILEAIYWALSTLTTQAETMPRQWLARSLSVFWMFAGVVFVASYTAQLTAVFTVERIRGAIEGPDDLPNRQVAALARGNAIDFLREHHAQVQEFSTIDEMFKALIEKKVDAVVAGAPILQYIAVHEGKGRVKMVGPVFNKAPVAFMLQWDSPLRKKLDVALIALREDGSYQQFYDKWFGAP